MPNQYVIVNATALDSSGALTILKQFVTNIPEDSIQWLVFIPGNISIDIKKNNVRLEPIHNVKSNYKRLRWDIVGLKKWIKKNNVKPLATVSLQNTGFNVGDKVPSFLYYHQPIPFFPFKWNFLKKKERTFWFYKNIYPLFVKFFLKKNTRVFVQLDYIKQGFSKYFNHPKNHIGIYSPTPPEIAKLECDPLRFNSNTLSLLYPATLQFYKNHRLLVKALEKVDLNLELLFTLNKNQDEFEDNRIKLIGVQPYKRICELYCQCDALVFPSYIETYGLPLIEAAMTGIPIIAADLPYAREVLAGYEGVKFVKYDDPEAWAKEIQNLEKGKRYTPIDISNRPGWKELFEEIENEIR